MSDLRNTVIEQNFPAIRRKSLTTLDGLIKNTIAEGFLTYIEDLTHGKPSLKQSEEAIGAHFKRIHHIIDTVDDHIARRLQNHENQVFSLVKNEIEEMREETRKIVEKLNEAIAQKNTQDEIWKLSNELDYFKSQTYKLFNENKKIREEMAALRKTLKEMEVEVENSDLLMQKLKKKYMKENFVKEKIVTLVKEKLRTRRMEEITLEKIDEIVKLEKGNKTRIKTEPTQSNSSQFFQSKIQINLNNNTIYEKSKKRAILEEQDKITEKHSIPSSFNEEPDLLPELPPVRFIRVQSEFEQQTTGKASPVIITRFKKLDKCIQTQEITTSIQQQTHRNGPSNHFSNTSYIQMPKQKTGKKLDISKNGFFVRSYNQKIDKLQQKNVSGSKGIMKKQGRHMRYMSNALNKSKMMGLNSEVRGSTNKSSLK